MGTLRIAVAAGLLLASLGSLATASPAPASCVLEAQLGGVVNAGMAEYAEAAVAEAERRRCQALLVVIDTPGGVLTDTRRIVRAFLGARLPVITYVAPSGAHAGSAGVFLTMAGHIAAMAPGTNMGAAHPVTGTGGDPEEAGGKHMADKVVEDTAAFARSIAEQRGRNAEWAEKAVRESASITAGQAVEMNVVDHMVDSRRALLGKVDGAEVTVEGSPVRLATADARIETLSMTLRQRALSVLGHPSLAYLMLMIGMLGIMVEIYNPGLIVPGAVGAFCLLLAAIGLNALPVNVGAVVLILIAMGLFIAEVFTAGFGLLTLGGLVSLVLGAMLLIDGTDPDFFAEPSVDVSWGVVLPMAVVMAGSAGLLAWNLRRVQRRRSPTGKEGLVGARGQAVDEVGPEGGHVSVQGERWQAVSDAPIARGTGVRVVSVDGLRIKVEPAQE
jgi:membrane-bound serine protease (ClpP class)